MKEDGFAYDYFRFVGDSKTLLCGVPDTENLNNISLNSIRHDI